MRFAVATSIIAAVEAETAAIVWVYDQYDNVSAQSGLPGAADTKSARLPSEISVSRWDGREHENRRGNRVGIIPSKSATPDPEARSRPPRIRSAMLRRPRRRRDDGIDDHAADVLFNVHVPMRKRLMFFAKIDADDVADRLSKIRLPASVVKAFQDSKIEIPETIRKAYDEFQNPTFQPDRRRLSSVEDFFRYTEEEGA